MKPSYVLKCHFGESQVKLGILILLQKNSTVTAKKLKPPHWRNEQKYFDWGIDMNIVTKTSEKRSSESCWKRTLRTFVEEIQKSCQIMSLNDHYQYEALNLVENCKDWY